MRTRIAVVGIVVFLVFATLGAQSSRGVIAGIVTDSTGSVLPGVTVTLRSSPEQTAITNGLGEFRFVDVPAGTYEIWYVLAGFATIRANVTVTDSAIARAAVEMRVAALAETITVTGETPTINLSTTAPSARPASAQRGAAPLGHFQRRGDVRGKNRDSFNTAAYDHIDENGFRRVAAAPLSTFSIDVDTASYANVRRFLTDGAMPPAGAVRIEELINYFHFDYRQPSSDAPFSVTTELAECPWNAAHRLALIGLQGRDIDHREPEPRNLVFLLDVSGSMAPPDRLPLVKDAMQMLTATLTASDRVAIVVYAGASGVALPSTTGDRKETIRSALADLQAGGSTNGEEGIRLAYHLARQNFIRGGVNRVILATDGDFNVGVTSQDELIRLIEQERTSGVFLSVLGVGTDNLKDSTMEKLADKGNGNYSYLDSLHEAQKVLVREAGATLTTIAKDVKIQVEFNPRVVGAYRLIGYENRVLHDEDFNDDTKDAGEIGAGHSVTALYEIVPSGRESSAPDVNPLKYQRQASSSRASRSSELATVKIRYKRPNGDTSQLLTAVVSNGLHEMTANIGFASAVAELGMLLRDSKHKGNASYESAIGRARRFRGVDSEGYRTEFVRLANLAASLRGRGAHGSRD